MSDLKVNKAGIHRDVYKGVETTLCKGCGHNSITNHLIKALYEFGLEPWRMAKLSGIGCSSKTTAYFVSQAHGFNSVHGRMPSIALGANMANRTLKLIGVSGDGDTASIGIGQFVHLCRRNLDVVYIIENNGVYGLTKGQFSATANKGSKAKKGDTNPLEEIDCCAHAILLGANYVGRSFSGDGKQVVPLLKGALANRGSAILDIISPCVTFNDHPGSTMSYDYMKEHMLPLHTVDYVEPQPEVVVDYAEGSTKEVKLPDGGTIVLKKLERDYDPTSKVEAISRLDEARKNGQHLTGLIYADPDRPDFASLQGLIDTPLYALDAAALRPSRQDLATVMGEYS